MKRVGQVKEGDWLDLQDDDYADPANGDQRDGLGEHPFWAYEYAKVESVEHETPECTVLHFENGPSCGFPPDHMVKEGHR